MGAMIRPVALMCAFVVGYLWPGGADFAWTIPWFVRFMLFMVFLKLEFKKMAIRPSHLAILFLNLALAAAFYGAGGLVGSRTLALAAFFTAIALCR
ncbi:MAG: hypothetical protein HUK22_07355, partial [Thermoguttaceae bacterium]|nr:hypothetical protein [Thermoguttaceae bacterium]